MPKTFGVSGYSLSLNERLEMLVEMVGGTSKAAKISKVSRDTVNNWKTGKTRVPLQEMLALAEVAKVSLDWVATGHSIRPNMKNRVSGASVQIPRYDVQLSAGNGNWNEDKPTPLDYIPFTKEFLQKKLGRKSTTDLLILEASGDSMLPTIAEDDLVLVDERVKRGQDGIYAFVQDGLARVKRFKFMPGGKTEIVSDNSVLYKPQIYSNEELQDIYFIGRVRWIGHTV